MYRIFILQQETLIHCSYPPGSWPFPTAPRSGTAQVIGGGIIVAFTDDPEKMKILESVAIAFDDIFFGHAPNAIQAQVVSAATRESAQEFWDLESSML